MAKFFLFPVLLAVGCFISGVYGMLHDQISYNVSPDYFHHLKFRQFGIPSPLHNRIGAALVGWYATWWMGILIGIPVLTVGFIMPTARTYMTLCLKSFVVVAATALVVGLGGLAWACYSVTTTFDYVWGGPPDAVADPVAFARVGVMHNFSYLGGFLGILTGCSYLVVARVNLNKNSPGPGDVDKEKS